MSTHVYDIVLYGATSFVGQLVAKYLAKYLIQNEQGQFMDPHTQQVVQWAIAGRSQNKLNQVKTDIGLPNLPTIIADSHNHASIKDLVNTTKLVISTVGPYLKYGEPLIKACVESGTHYVDLSGEAVWIRLMLDKYKDTAKSTGAKIVNCCGFDSLPSDLGVWFTQQKSKQIFDNVCETIHMRVKAIKGGFSGGTVASMLGVFELASHNKTIRKQLANPYVLVTDHQPPTILQAPMFMPKFAVSEQKWLAPFIMAGINTRVVHRSNYLLDYAYGRNFRYEETMWLPNNYQGKIRSYFTSYGLLGFGLAASVKPVREFMAKKILPKSGEGPSPKAQENGFFDIRLLGITNKGQYLHIKVTGDKDPGYAATAKMLSQSALCLLQETQETQGGFWTPASIMAAPLIQRLQQHAGMTFEHLNNSIMA